MDLPRGPRREPVRVRDREYDINGNQSRVLATVGAFRVVSSRDLEASLGRAGNPRSSDLRHLRESGLVQTVPLPGHRDRVVTLTEHGRELLEARRRPGEDAAQAFYAGIRKPRELEHDTQVYRAYLEAADRLTERGDRLRRVVLDYELKREYQRFLQERNRGRADSDGRPDRSAEEIALWAVEHNLPYFDEQVHFPDVRIEYEDIDGRSRDEDVEVTTVHYRGAHAAAAAKSGFSQYGGLSARISGAGVESRWRRSSLPEACGGAASVTVSRSRQASVGQPKTLPNDVGIVEAFTGERPVRLEHEAHRLCQIRPGLRQRRSLGIGARELLDEGDVALGDRAEHGGEFERHGSMVARDLATKEESAMSPEERIDALSRFGFTGRQAAFLTRCCTIRASACRGSSRPSRASRTGTRSTGSSTAW